VPSGFLDTVILFYFVLVLGLAGLSDLRHREVEPLLWAAALPAAPGFAAYGLYTRGLPLDAAAVLAAASLAPALAGLALYRLCLLGGADVAALAFVGLAGLGLPTWKILPPGLLAVVYSAPASLLLLAAEAFSAGCVFDCRVPPEEVARRHRRMWLVFTPPAGGEGCSLSVDSPTLASQGARGRIAIPLVAALALGGLAAAVVGDEPLLSLLAAQP